LAAVAAAGPLAQRPALGGGEAAAAVAADARKIRRRYWNRDDFRALVTFVAPEGFVMTVLEGARVFLVSVSAAALTWSAAQAAAQAQPDTPAAPPAAPSAAAGDQPGEAPAPAAPAPPAPAFPPAAPGPNSLQGADLQPKTIEAAQFDPNTPPAQQSALIVKVQTLLDRAHVSPGSIDGRPGQNLDKALAIYESQHHLPLGFNPQVVGALEKQNGAPIVQTYVITDADEKGPFIGHLPSDFYAQSKLGYMGYTNPEQEIAERFHMSPGLIEAMNPGADYAKPGTSLVVVAPHTGGLGAKVARIEVDKTHDEVMAFGADGALVGSFPSTIGSLDHPAPSGSYTVAGVRFDPVYTYDPRVLTWGPKTRGRFTIKSGPNNPTGVVWIALSRPTYGIHGTPNAELIGKTNSHGCVRLTNWDAWDLGSAVKAGAPVVFTGDKPEQASKA
jgi:lipoprotein-anchoring transpeptidase ErfK/SrfK